MVFRFHCKSASVSLSLFKNHIPKPITIAKNIIRIQVIIIIVENMVLCFIINKSLIKLILQKCYKDINMLFIFICSLLFFSYKFTINISTQSRFNIVIYIIANLINTPLFNMNSDLGSIQPSITALLYSC